MNSSQECNHSAGSAELGVGLESQFFRQMATARSAPSEDRVLELVDELFRNEVHRYAYEPVVLGADRHGSYVWEALKHGEPERHVTFSCTLTPQSDLFAS